ILVTTQPDLVTTAVSNPPATAAVGGSFQITDTVKNVGTASAGASTTRYYLSSTAGNFPFTQTRAVGSINAGGSSSGSVNVTVPAVTPGTYSLLACADVLNAVVEFDNTNNC